MTKSPAGMERALPSARLLADGLVALCLLAAAAGLVGCAASAPTVVHASPAPARMDRAPGVWYGSEAAAPAPASAPAEASTFATSAGSLPLPAPAPTGDLALTATFPSPDPAGLPVCRLAATDAAACR